MHSSFYPPAIHDLIATLRRLPGVGLRSAEKLAFSLLEWPEKEVQTFCESLLHSKSSVIQCERCGCLFDQTRTCWSCSKESPSCVCVVSSAKEAFAIHSTGAFKGYFHVLGGLLDPLKGIEPEHLRFTSLLRELLNGKIQEVLLALDATLEGDATSLYLKQVIEKEILPQRPELKVSRLAFGMPMNSSLDLVDPATLSRAVSAKNYW